jgi:hypothetical protein
VGSESFGMRFWISEYGFIILRNGFLFLLKNFWTGSTGSSGLLLFLPHFPEENEET